MSRRFYLGGTYPNVYLTRREAQCAEHLLHALRAKEIADILGLSKRTIESHISRIRAKLSCHNVAELIGKLKKTKFAKEKLKGRGEKRGADTLHVDTNRITWLKEITVVARKVQHHLDRCLFTSALRNTSWFILDLLVSSNRAWSLAQLSDALEIIPEILLVELHAMHYKQFVTLQQGGSNIYAIYVGITRKGKCCYQQTCSIVGDVAERAVGHVSWDSVEEMNAALSQVTKEIGFYSDDK